jgi:hypothetical protein
VRLLEGVRQGHNTADRYHRITFRGGCGDTGHKVAGSRARRDKTDSWPSGQTPYGGGHERGVLFVPTHDQLRTLIAQYIKGRHDLPAWDTENMFDILLDQASDQQLRGGLSAFLYFRDCELCASPFVMAVLCVCNNICP